MVEPSIFDLLEPLADRLRDACGPWLHPYFARRTGGVDIEGIIAALTTSPEQGWQPIETFNRAEGKALIFDPKWGVAEGLRDHTGRWGLATFNGQVIEAHPTKWRPLPEPPGDQQ
jgi:hypothetical protein